MSSNHYLYSQNSKRYSNNANEKSWNNWQSNASSRNQRYQQNESYNYPSYTSRSKQSYHSRSYPSGNNHNDIHQQQSHRYSSSHENSSRVHRYDSQYNKSQPSWQHNRNQSSIQYNKRSQKRQEPPKAKDSIVNVARKKKKPLSQNVSKKGWNEEDAEKAFKIEREYNSKKHSLVIKFPDPELNKDIVKEFHPAIENVHFQQASTPRFCFVTLHKNADIDLVMSALNRQKFGQGYLTAELKKDKEEEKVSSKDIDPYTLYVGNLANEVTKRAVRNKFPKTIRIDIGYAQKMKYTRYAFVRFATVHDSIEAFQNTYNSDLYARSLIVRFRRLHGHANLSGEAKLPYQSKTTSEDLLRNNATVVHEKELNFSKGEERMNVTENEDSIAETSLIDLNFVKNEPESCNESDDELFNPLSMMMPDDETPIINAVDVKNDKDLGSCEESSDESDVESDLFGKNKNSEIIPTLGLNPVKMEPEDEDFEDLQLDKDNNENSSDHEFTSCFFKTEESDSDDSDYEKRCEDILK